MFTRIGSGSTLWKGQRLKLPWGELIHHGSTVTLSQTETNETRTLDEGLSPFLEVHWTPTYVIVGSAAGPELFMGTLDRADFEQIGTVLRWNDNPHFTPGVHAVRFFDVDNRRCVVSTEAGLALATVDQGLVWQFHHNDITNRVLSVDSSVIELMGIDTATSVVTSTGETTERPVKKS